MTLGASVSLVLTNKLKQFLCFLFISLFHTRHEQKMLALAGSFTACKHNKGCSDLYQRITNKGKSKKLALIAVSNKLLKQCFAIAKSGHPYDPTFVSVLEIK